MNLFFIFFQLKKPEGCKLRNFLTLQTKNAQKEVNFIIIFVFVLTKKPQKKT